MIPYRSYFCSISIVFRNALSATKLERSRLNIGNSTKVSSFYLKLLVILNLLSCTIRIGGGLHISICLLCLRWSLQPPQYIFSSSNSGSWNFLKQSSILMKLSSFSSFRATLEWWSTSFALELYSSSIKLECHSIATWHLRKKSSINSSVGGMTQPLQSFIQLH